jgi:hypothetical protein
MFDFVFALKALSFAYAAFCPESALQSWTCEWCTHRTLVNSTTVTSNALTGAYGYVSVWNDTVVVAFRGSSDVMNWILDIDAVQESPFPSLPNVSVHAGFYNAYMSVQTEVIAGVSRAVALCPHCTQLLATGHSLGAAMSGFAAFDLSVRFPMLRTALINYGMPRIGNKAFATEFKNRVAESFRCVHFEDLVPHLPFEAWVPHDFHHIAREVWWTQEAGNPAKTFKVCDDSGEDPSCSDSIPIWHWNPADHGIYLGVHNDNCGTK